MEQVLNRVDRNQAFIKFLIFFLVTIVLTVAAIFVNYKLPSKENTRLREQAAVQRQSDAGELRFLAIMKEAVDLQDSIKDGGMQTGSIKTQLDNAMDNLYRISKSDNSIYGQLNKVIYDKIQEVEQKKISIQQVNKDIQAKYSSLQIELQNCQKALSEKPVTTP
ncbi:MAG: hypothetical protein ABJB86_07675 [Bacteroidota bacterium]